MPCLAGHRNGPQFPAFDQRRSASHIDNGDIELVPHQVGVNRSPAFVGYVIELDAGEVGKPLENQLISGRIGACAERFLVVLRGLHDIGQRDQFRILRHDDRGHAARQAGDRLEILERIVRQILHRDRIHRHQGDAREKDCVAVGGRRLDRRHRNHAACAGAILDHDRLSEDGRHLFAEKAGRGIGTTACRKRHDHFDGSIGKVFCLTQRQRGDRHQTDKCKKYFSHFISSSFKKL